MNTITIERRYRQLAADRNFNLMLLAEAAIDYVNPKFEAKKEEIAASMKKTAALVAEIDRQQIELADSMPVEEICKIFNQ